MYNITELIPQRPPIVMVDEFFGIDGAVSTTGFTVCDGNMFVVNGKLDECGIIEHIAQSAAARVGYIFREKGEPVPLGYIGSVNKFKLFGHPEIGAKLHTTLEVIQEIFGISLVEAKVYVGEQCVAECRMKIFLEQ